MVKVVSRECRFVFHKPASSSNKDTHIIKEMLHYEDGTSKKNLRILEDFRRPFWTTMEHKRNHKHKKESELLTNLTETKCTESELGRTIASKLGSQYNGISDLWTVKSSPYVYGIDVNSRTYIKQLYQQQFPDKVTPYEVCILDIEADIRSGNITVMSIATTEKIFTVINKDFLKGKVSNRDTVSGIMKDVVPKLEYLYKKYVPNTELSSNIQVEYKIVNNDLQTVLEAIKEAHRWKPDFMSVWNIGYDVPKMLETLDKYDVMYTDVFCDPDLPNNLKYFNYKEGPRKKITASGKFKPIEPKDRWDTVYCPASFYWIDAMSSYNYIRIGGKTIPGGYSLDNVLGKELGTKLQKLKFADEETEFIKGPEWHQYMSDNKPLEYSIYNQWDVMSVLELDKKTLDLSQVLPMLSGISNFDIFNSGPKRIVDAMHFFYIENGRVLSCKDPRAKDNKLLGLGGWITLLPSHRISDLGQRVLEGSDVRSNARLFTYDSDQVSGYPSNTQAANVSKDTTAKEIISIEGMEISDFRVHNINLLLGKVNAISYASNMLKMPSMLELVKYMEQKNK